MSCGVIPLILLQSADRQHAPIAPSQSVAHSVLTKHTTLNTLSHTIQEALQVRPALEIPKNATPLLTPQEEKVLSMWMDGVSNNAIAAALNIHGKTVYTYKRNIRMKLHWEPLLAVSVTPREGRLTVRHDVVPFFIIAELLSLHQKWRYRLQKYPVLRLVWYYTRLKRKKVPTQKRSQQLSS